MKEPANLPPIISDMIVKLGDPKINPYEKNNIASTIEIIGQACITAAARWRDKFNKAEAARADTRKNRRKIRA